jgi:hypothetical protein
LAECINHPGKEGIYRCAKCKKHFCLACVELIDDKAYCYDCLKEIVKEVREETVKSLTLKILIAALLALLVAIVSMHKSYELLQYMPGYIYKMSVGSHEPFNTNLLSNVPALVIGLAFLALGGGLAATKKWSYRYGLVICIVSFVVELMDAMNIQGGIEFFQSYPLSETSLFYGIMVIGPLFILIAVFGSRRELTGW